MRIVLYCSFLISFLCFHSSGYSQSKQHKHNKGTSKREIRKRQQKANERDSESNLFNPLQTMGSRKNEARDDLIWHSESANTVYKRAGNISLTTPSRYGIRSDLELSSILGFDYWVPNIFIKKRWKKRSGSLPPGMVSIRARPG